MIDTTNYPETIDRAALRRALAQKQSYEMAATPSSKLIGRAQQEIDRLTGKIMLTLADLNLVDTLKGPALVLDEPYACPNHPNWKVELISNTSRTTGLPAGTLVCSECWDNSDEAFLDWVTCANCLSTRPPAQEHFPGSMQGPPEDTYHCQDCGEEVNSLDVQVVLKSDIDPHTLAE